MNAIAFQNVSKSFPRQTGQHLLRNRIGHWLRGERAERFHALKRISFQVAHGESLAVVGPNGAGKSTLLGLMAGLAIPDEGSIEVNGRVAALLELGSGFHPDLTGRENVALNASLIGLLRKRTAELFDEIVEFSGVGDFIDEPLRTYSTGMMMRLAFSVAINMDPNVLLVDEVLAVGDQSFQAKCIERIHQFRNSGRTIVAVSHAAGMVQELCDRAIWLDHGELIMAGQVREVTEAYAGRQGSAAAEA
jgi:ABC-type polysaccharide/polyol phosphate transport system ATPase subunit